MKNIAIFAKKIAKQDLPIFEELLAGVLSLGWQPVLEKELALQLQTKLLFDNPYQTFSSHQDLQLNYDLMISLGGDGTFFKGRFFYP